MQNGLEFEFKKKKKKTVHNCLIAKDYHNFFLIL